MLTVAGSLVCFFLPAGKEKWQVVCMPLLALFCMCEAATRVSTARKPHVPPVLPSVPCPPGPTADGFLSYSEFTTSMQSLLIAAGKGTLLSPSQLARVAALLDTSQTGRVNYIQFADAMTTFCGGARSGRWGQQSGLVQHGAQPFANVGRKAFSGPSLMRAQ